MIYTIKHGSIAGLQRIVSPDGVEISAIYAGDSKPAEAYIDGDMSEDIWQFLPKSVQASINKQFGIVFSLPYDSREEFVKSSIPFEVKP